MANVTIIQPTKSEEKNIKIRCAAYCRVSSDSDDQLNSFMAQTRYYSQIFEGSQTEILIDVYADEGVTGTCEDKRIEFQRMIKDCRKGKIDRIYTKSISRFARNTRDCLKNVRELKSLGITIFFEKENIDTANISDEMMITVMGGLAQEESTSISQNMRWSIKKRMESGKMKMTGDLLGYDLVNGELVVNPKEAEIVKQIFDLYLNGFGTQSIADILNSQTQKSNWTSSYVSLILKNEKYIGDQLFQKRFTTETMPFKQVRNKGEMPQYYYSNRHEPIISREVFEQVQAVLESHQRYDSGVNYNRVLARKIHCGECGATYKFRKNSGKFYWVCRRHVLKAENCGSKPIPEEKFYTAFIRLWGKLWCSYKEILLPIANSLRELKVKKFGGQAGIMEIHKEIANLKEQNHILTRLKTKGLLDEAKYLTQSTELTAKISRLQNTLKKLTRSDDEDEIIEQIEMLIDIFSSRKSPMTKFEETVFESIVEKIVVEDNTTLEFNLIGGLKFTENI